MKLAISNIAWSKEYDEEMYEFLSKNGIEGLEIAPTRIFEKNPYMNTIYPTIESRAALTVFQIYKGTGEYFNLSKRPIERYTFSFGDAELTWNGYFINDKCIHCFQCLSVCPQSCININEKSAYIRQENCLHCGNCFDICPASAIERR